MGKIFRGRRGFQKRREREKRGERERERERERGHEPCGSKYFRLQSQHAMWKRRLSLKLINLTNLFDQLINR
ncbi:MAG: hypothetical protein J8272_00865, partial ['Prunus persica' phytoplasma PP2]|nr:hypothetical protein ['Prunus persica' phytoplasma PP2]